MRRIYVSEYLFDRLDRVARAKCLNVHNMAETYLLMAACFEEVQSHQMAVSILEGVLRNLIENEANTV